jgi:hypothetical protein
MNQLQLTFIISGTLFLSAPKLAQAQTPLPSPAPSPVENSCGFLAAAQGDVEILRAQAADAKAGPEVVRYMSYGHDASPLQCDDVVVTHAGGSAKIEFENGKIVLGSSSRIEIGGYTGAERRRAVTLMVLRYGGLRARIEKSTVQSSGPKEVNTFEVRTRSAVVGVRGTDFYVGCDRESGNTSQATLDGLVEVTTLDRSRKILVNPGQEVSVTSSKKPLAVQPMAQETKSEIRSVSVLAKDDSQFTEGSAVKILGSPKTWTLKREALPDKFKDIKNEY